MEVRRLHVLEDKDLFRSAYHWDDEAPRWRRDCELVFGVRSEAEWLSQLNDPARIDMGIFKAADATDATVALMGVITLQLVGAYMYEVHLLAQRHASLELIQRGCEHVRDHGPEGLKFIWLPRCNRAIIQLVKRLGFKQDGWVMWSGSTHGRAIEWQRWTLEG